MFIFNTFGSINGFLVSHLHLNSTVKPKQDDILTSIWAYEMAMCYLQMLPGLVEYSMFSNLVADMSSMPLSLIGLSKTTPDEWQHWRWAFPQISHSGSFSHAQPKKSKPLSADLFVYVIYPSVLPGSVKSVHSSAVYAARRMTYSRSETYVFLEPGKDEQFVTLEELRKRVRGWLERWPEKSLPKDLTKFNSLEDAAAHLVQSACELEIGRGIGSIQWYEVNLE
eukprot:Gb_30183 [translate_table: standard]